MITIGLFGGSFDPPHLGHVAVAKEVAEVCDLVLISPARRNPHKDEALADIKHRQFMMKLAMVPSINQWAIYHGPEHRAPPTYTIDTLEELNTMFSRAEIKLVIGSDNIPLTDWKDYQRFPEFCDPLVFRRGDTSEDIQSHLEKIGFDTIQIEPPPVKVGYSSTKIRELIRKGDDQWKHMVPHLVGTHIEAQGLYK